MFTVALVSLKCELIFVILVFSFPFFFFNNFLKPIFYQLSLYLKNLMMIEKNCKQSRRGIVEVTSF